VWVVRPGSGVVAVKRQLTIADAAADEQPVESGGLIGRWDDRNPGPVVLTSFFGSVAGAVPVPRPFAQSGGDVVATGGPVQTADVHPVALRDRENVADPAALQVAA
jgi:hypothetical protein